jgi:hypothetical protein
MWWIQPQESSAQRPRFAHCAIGNGRAIKGDGAITPALKDDLESKVAVKETALVHSPLESAKVRF